MFHDIDNTSVVREGWGVNSTNYNACISYPFEHYKYICLIYENFHCPVKDKYYSNNPNFFISIMITTVKKDNYPLK